MALGTAKGGANERRPCSPSSSVATEEMFHKGVANSVWQSSGHGPTNWGRFISRFKFKFFPTVRGATPADRDFHDCPDFWNRYVEDIKLLKDIGANAFRFSLEWSRIEPEQGRIDPAAIARYHEILDALAAADIEPHVTLHHFVHPEWWEKLGGWVKGENVDAFVDFARLCYREFGSKVTMWGTINEPSCTSFCSTICGMHPPGGIARLTACGKIIQNMLIAHTRIYQMIKGMPGGERSKIGIVHHHLRFHPASKNKWITPHVRWLTHWLTEFWGAPTIFKYFETGEFEWRIPLWGRVLHHVDADAPKSLDWWGLNYYTTGVINWFCFPHFSKEDIVTDMGYALHPGGMYEWIMESHRRLRVPIYITETGCADEKDEFRATCIRTYTKAMLAAMQDGADVRGFYYWTLTDNFEWNFGWTAKFGLFSFIPDKKDADRVLRAGAKPLLDLYKTLPDLVVDAKKLVASSRLIDFSVAVNRGLQASTGLEESRSVPMSRASMDASSVEVEMMPIAR